MPCRAAPALAPPLKWAGGKRWLVPTLRELWGPHAHRRLVEPFVGGMAVALGLSPERALLGDANPHLVNFYRWLQRGLRAERPFENDAEAYRRCRAEFNRLVAAGGAGSQAAAELFYYLNRTGFNGLCRFNQRGGFNVPFGRYKTIAYQRDFSAYQGVLSRWCLVSGDFAALSVQPEDFIYADPPYDATFTSYSAGGFAWADQVRLAEWLATHPGPVVASNQATPRILELYGALGFTLETLKAPRRIASNGDRTPAEELLALKGI